jgi:hypothetical protein
VWETSRQPELVHGILARMQVLVEHGAYDTIIHVDVEGKTALSLACMASNHVDYFPFLLSTHDAHEAAFFPWTKSRIHSSNNSKKRI